MNASKQLDSIINIFLEGFRNNDDTMDEQRNDKELLTSMIKRLIKTERWADVDYVRGLLAQDSCGAPGALGVPGIDEIISKGIEPENLSVFLGISHQQAIGRQDRSVKKLNLDKKLSIEFKPLNLTYDTQDKRSNIDGSGVHRENICYWSIE